MTRVKLAELIVEVVMCLTAVAAVGMIGVGIYEALSVSPTGAAVGAGIAAAIAGFCWACYVLEEKR